MYGYIPSQLLLFKTNLFMSGLKRSLITSVTQKSPITPALLLRLYTCIDVNNSFHLCMWAAMLFLFFTFVRKSNILPVSSSKFDKVKQVCCRDVVCYRDKMFVNLNWSKTVQFAQRKVCIPVSAIPGSTLCPVQAYRKLQTLVPCSYNMSPFCYYDDKGCITTLSYTVFVVQLRQWLQQVGIKNCSQFCTHSFRRGGATFAFQCGVNPTLIKAQGDWASDCYLKYVSLSLQDKLLTTSSMANVIRNL